MGLSIPAWRRRLTTSFGESGSYVCTFSAPLTAVNAEAEDGEITTSSPPLPPPPPYQRKLMGAVRIPPHHTKFRCTSPRPMHPLRIGLPPHPPHNIPPVCPYHTAPRVSSVAPPHTPREAPFRAPMPLGPRLTLDGLMTLSSARRRRQNRYLRSEYQDSLWFRNSRPLMRYLTAYARV